MRSVVLCLLFFASTILAYSSVSVFQNEDMRQCSKGPLYWCANIRNAKTCQAVKHCIQTVWRYKVLPEDNGDVCKICKDMVAEARAQLQSKVTQEELKEVLEGTCALIPLKAVAKECMKLADEFAPELVETLASEMNPQVVCSVAGLCNNAHTDQLLAERAKNRPAEVKKCDGCYNVTELLKKKFQETPRDDILNNILEMCGTLGSFSDSCAAITVTYFDNWYNLMHKNLVPEEVCDFAGMCSYKFHNHRTDNVELTIESSVGVVKQVKDDMACDFCEQLIVHLRDVLVANTTEAEFQKVLRGLCKQTGSFADECLSIVNEYYGVIYNFLLRTLVPLEVCCSVGLCPRPASAKKGPIWPLLPVKTAEQLESSSNSVEPLVVPLTPLLPADAIIGQDEGNSYIHHVPLSKDGVAVSNININSVQLPIERMIPQTIATVGNKQLCEFCEYFLHYLQQVLTTPATEAEIERVMKKSCDELPKEFEDQCREFVQTYGDAAIALLAQEIDPSQVCPLLRICPSEKVLIDLFNSVNDKPSCPLCLLAVQELQNTLQNNKTEESIKRALDGLCTKLSKSLATECKDFVEEYSDQLVDMLVADFTPQEICAYLKLCDPSLKPNNVEITSNEIPQSSLHRTMPQDIIHNEIEKFHEEACVLCEYVLSEIDKQLKDKSTEEEIKTIVHDVCNYMPHTVSKQCNDFVNQYADLVITLLAESMDPKAVCTAIKLCNTKDSLQDSVTECAVCDVALGELRRLKSSATVRNVSNLIKKTCISVPEKYISKCDELVEIYGPSIVNLSEQNKEFHEICEMIGKCPKGRQVTNLLGGERCTWGPSYWCRSEEHATSCGAKLHCQEKVWKSEKPNGN